MKARPLSREVRRGRGASTKYRLLLRLLTAAAGTTLLICVASATAAQSTTAGAKPALTIGVTYSGTLNASTGGFEAELSTEPLIKAQWDKKTITTVYSPGIATSWGFANGYKVFTFALRHDARYSTGAAVTAKTVVTYLNWIDSVTAPIQLTDPKPSSIQAIGKWKVRITSPTPNPALLDLLTQEPGWIEAPSCLDKANTNLNTRSCGAGQYMIDPSQTVPNSQITYVPNPYYYDKSKVHFSKVIAKVIPASSSMLQALEAGQIQIAQGDATTANAAKSAGFRVAGNTTAWQGFGWDFSGTTAPPLANLKVRQALQYALDRKAIARAAWGPFTTPSCEPAQTDAYDQKFVNYYPYNPTKAKALLTAAGYPNGFTIAINTVNFPPYSTAAEGVAEYFGKVGVTVKVMENPLSVFLDPSVLKATPIDLAVGPGTILPMVSFRYSHSLWTGQGFGDPTLSALAAKARRQPTQANRNAIVDRLVTQAESLTLAVTSSTIVYGVKGIGNLPNTPVTSGNGPIHGLDSVYLKTK